MNKILNFLKVLCLLLIVFCISSTYDFIIKKQNITQKEIVIEKGDKPSKIYKKLGIKYTIFDKLYYKFTNNDKKIKEGYYYFDINLSKYELIDQLLDFNNTQISLTIPEGFTTNEVLERIERLGLAKKEEMLQAMQTYDFYYKHSDNFEGYFFPQTYYFSKGNTPNEILDKILKEFLKNFPSNKYDKNKMYDIVTLASIIEKEAKLDEDRPKVSKVFYNRLKLDMPLQSDATLKYELNRGATKKDLKENNSRYNTYKYKGLTPTPISNPGILSIKAALYPQKDFDNLYFFMNNGKTYYSKTHTEHLKQRKESGNIK